MTKARDTSNLVSSVTGIAVTLSGDPVVLGVGNTEHVRITGSGLVGIRTDNPLSNLQVTDGAGGAGLLLGARNSNAKYQYINFNGTIAGDHAWQFGRSPASGVGPDNGLYVYNLLTSSTEIGITTTGNTGIGTDNPSARLDVVSDISSGYIAEFRQAHASNTGQIVIDSPVDGASRPSYMDYATGGSVKWATGLAYLDSDRSFHIGTGSGLSNSKLTIKTDGKTGVGTYSPSFKLHGGEYSGPNIVGLFETNQTDAFISFKASGTTATSTVRIGALGDDFVAYVNGGYRFRVKSDGRIGIGNHTSPKSPLHIQGEYNDQEPVSGIGTGSLMVSNSDILYATVFGVRSNGNGWIQQTRVDGTATNYDLLLNPIGGSIGINTSANINGRLTIQANDDSEILFQVRSHNGRSAQLKSTASASSTDPFVFHTNNSWGFDVDTIRTLTLSSDYNVGIGDGASSPFCKLQVTDTATHTAYDSTTPSITDCTLAIANQPTSEAINNHATIQFNVNGGTYNRVCSISAVAESASNRYGALTFCTDDANTRSEKMRITGDGRVLIGGQTTGVKAYVYDTSGSNASFYSYHNGTGAYAGLFRCDNGDSTQYACYGYVNTSSSYSSGGILGYSINSSKYAILGYWSTAAYYGLYSNGLIYSSGGFSSSDERLKDVSSRIEGGVLDDLTSLVPVEYTWKDNTEQGRGLEGVTQIGLIAQEVEVNFPHLVMENLHTRITGINSTSLNEEIGMCKSIEYGKLTCYLLVALTEAYDKIKALEQHVGIAST